MTNLRLVSFEAEKQQALYFAVRKDWPELVGIINKTLDSISGSRKARHKQQVGRTGYRYGLRSYHPYHARGRRPDRRRSDSVLLLDRAAAERDPARKQIQLDLEKAKREADEANEFKSSFMARMSHEIRTPLHAITGMSYLLKRTGTSLTQSMYIDRIIQAANSMLGIINDILDFSKIEAGKVEPEITFSMDR